jgi:hypothetical protein
MEKSAEWTGMDAPHHQEQSRKQDARAKDRGNNFYQRIATNPPRSFTDRNSSKPGYDQRNQQGQAKPKAGD